MALAQPLLAKDCSEEAANDDDLLSAGLGPRDQNDKWWGIAFKINVAVTLLSTLLYGNVGIQALRNNAVPGIRLFPSEESGIGWRSRVIACVAMMAVTWALFQGMLGNLARRPHQGIQQLNWLRFLLMVVTSSPIHLCLAQAVYSERPALFPLYVVTGLIFLVLYRQRGEYRLGAANLKALQGTAVAIKSMPGLAPTVLLLTGLEIVWIAACVCVMVGTIVSSSTFVLKNRDGTTTDLPGMSCSRLEYFGCRCDGVSYARCDYIGGNTTGWVALWLTSLVWGISVIKSVTAATVSGSVATWTLSRQGPGDDDVDADTTATTGRRHVREAFHRAIHASFGSLCKSACIFYFFRRAAHVPARVFPRAMSFLSWIRPAPRSAVPFALCLVGVYGCSFSEAARRVRELFQRLHRESPRTTMANTVMLGAVGSWMGVVVKNIAALALLALLLYDNMEPSKIRWSSLFLVFEVAAGDRGNAMLPPGLWCFCLAPVLFGYLAIGMVLLTALEVFRSGYTAFFVCNEEERSEIQEAGYGHHRHA